MVSKNPLFTLRTVVIPANRTENSYDPEAVENPELIKGLFSLFSEIYFDRFYFQDCACGAIPAVFPISAVQSSTPTLNHNIIMLMDT